MEEYIGKRVLMQKIISVFPAPVFEAEILLISDKATFFKYKDVDSGKSHWGKSNEYIVADTISYKDHI